MTVLQLWQQYEYHLRIRRRSVNTLSFYRVGAQGFTAFLVTEGLIDDVATLTVTHLRRYMTWLEERGLGIGGIHARGRTLKALFNFALREELIERNPVTGHEARAADPAARPNARYRTRSSSGDARVL